MSRHHGIGDIYALSSMQQGILFHAARAPHLYCCRAEYRMTGPLDVDAFERAWRHVFQRHAVLRTSIVWKQVDTPVQVVHSTVDLPWTYHDARDSSLQEREASLAARVRADRQLPFDLARAPLARLALVRTADAAHRFYWMWHHILLDGWSNWLVLKEAWACYAAYAKGVQPLLPAPRPYRDYIAWLQQQDAATAERFWSGYLRDVVPAPVSDELPGDATGEDDTRTSEARGSAEETACITRAARAARVTVNTLLHAAWALVLSRLTGRSDVVFGATVSGRPETLDGVDRMVGLFINTLPVRVRVDGRMTVAEWLASIQQGWAEAMRRAHVPLVQIAAWAGVPGAASLFDSVVVLESHPTDAFEQQYEGAAKLIREVRDLRIEAVATSESLNYPVALLANAARTLTLKLLYHPRAIDETIARQLPHLLLATIRSLADHMDQRLEQAAAVALADTGDGQSGANATGRTWTDAPSLPAALAAQAARTPDAVAVVSADGQITYRFLEAWAARIARELLQNGIGAESCVGVCLDRSLELVAALVGVLRAGAAYVPLDPGYPAERLAYMVSQAKVPVVLVGTAATGIPAVPAHLLPVAPRPVSAGERTPAPAPVHGAQLAYVIYTSGSTGQPKGAMNTHAGICNRLRWMQEAYELAPGDRVLQKTPTSFDVSVWEFFWPLTTGATLVMARPGGHRDSRYIADVIEAEQITTVHFVPSLLELFVRELGDGRCETLRRVIVSGEALPPAVSGLTQVRLPRAGLHNLYGPTEAAVDVTAWTCRPTDRGCSVPIGTPIANTQVYVLDADARPVRLGAPGELCLGGVGLARGYVHRPDLTAERFVPDTASGAIGQRLYRTGDRGRWHPLGYLEYLGRLDHQVKIRGHRIELGEIERQLTSHAAVAQAAAVVQGTAAGDSRLVAFVVPAAPGTTTGAAAEQIAGEVRAHLARRLPPYMLPSLVLLDALPQTANGKVDRRALEAATATVAARRRPLLPRDSVEAYVLQVWEDLLGRRDIGVRDDFFEVGGHSLKALSLAARLSKTVAVDVPVDIIFERRTVEQLAVFLRHHGNVPAGRRSSLVPLQTRGSRPPLFCVHPGSGLVHCYVSLSRRLGPDQPVFAFQSPALASAETPLTAVAPMAARYVADLRVARPTGPYQIAGLSMGAVVAFEMARQLADAGEPVTLLALLDGTYAEFPAEPSADTWEAESARWASRYVLRKAKEDLGIAPDAMTDLSREAQLERYLDGAKARDLIPPDVTPAQFRRFMAVFAANEWAMFAYRPHPYGGPVTVVRSQRSTDATLGWSRYAPVTDVAVIGDRHGDCIQEPFIGALAAFLAGAIDRAAERGTAPAARAPHAPV